MRKAFVVLSLAALMLGGLSLSGCASGGKCCDGNPPCAKCEEMKEKGCPDCKAAGGMCEKCKAGGGK